MDHGHTVESLKTFELEVAAAFNAGKIRAPIHLSGGNEAQLLDIFKDVGPDDWVATAWRSHYHCLLKGVPPARVMADILAGRSITLNYPDHKIISSAIVGGVLPIALGIALAIKRRGGSERVWAFMGDMTATTGVYHECVNYAANFNLPIRFVVEDNGVSVLTATAEVWGADNVEACDAEDPVDYIQYVLPWPHAGAGRRVEF